MKAGRTDAGASGVRTRAVARTLVLLSCLALALGLPAPALAEGAFTVDWTGGLLTVTAEQAPLGRVLGEVARRTGLRIRGAETLREPVTVSFSSLRLAEGIRRLLARVDHVIVEQAFRQGEIRPTLVLLPGRHLADAGPGSEDDPSAPGERLDSSLADPDPGVRRQAVERLADVRGEWAFSRLAAALQDESAEVREGAITALGLHGPEAINPITTLLQRETYPAARLAAVQVLGQFGGPELAGLFQGMLGDPNPLVRRAAVEGLGQSGGPTAGEVLRNAALDQDVGVREAALDALGVYARDPKLALEEAGRQ
jgi:hypothetical protein